MYIVIETNWLFKTILMNAALDIGGGGDVQGQKRSFSTYCFRIG